MLLIKLPYANSMVIDRWLTFDSVNTKPLSYVL